MGGGGFNNREHQTCTHINVLWTEVNIPCIPYHNMITPLMTSLQFFIINLLGYKMKNHSSMV